jgi:hypothetical protein
MFNSYKTICLISTTFCFLISLKWQNFRDKVIKKSTETILTGIIGTALAAFVTYLTLVLNSKWPLRVLVLSSIFSSHIRVLPFRCVKYHYNSSWNTNIRHGVSLFLKDRNILKHIWRIIYVLCSLDNDDDNNLIDVW